MNELNKTSNKNDKKKSQLTMSLLIGLIVLVLIIVLVIRPGWAKITARQGEIQTNQTQLKRLQDKVKAIAAAQVEFEKIGNQIQVINQAVPDYSDPALVMKMLEKLAAEIVDEGGPLVIVSSSMPVVPNDLPEATRVAKLKEENEVSIVLNLVGDYQAVKDYIIKIKSLRHNFKVDKITFSAPQNTDQPFLDVVLNLKYSYFN